MDNNSTLRPYVLSSPSFALSLNTITLGFYNPSSSTSTPKRPQSPDSQRLASRTLALGMELPENTFVNLHEFDAVGDTHGTYHRRQRSEWSSSRG